MASMSPRAGELRVALDSRHADPAEDQLSPAPASRDPELRQAVAAGVLVNVESARELPCAGAGRERELGTTARVALRVNPDFELKGSGMKMGGGPKQFGVDVDVVPDLLQQIADLGLGFEGFHLFAGSQNLRASRSARHSRRAMNWRCGWPPWRLRRCAS